MSTFLRTLTHIADSPEVVGSETIFIVFDYDCPGIDVKRYERALTGFAVSVIVRILEQFKHKTSIACVKIFGKPDDKSQRLLPKGVSFGT